VLWGVGVGVVLLGAPQGVSCLQAGAVGCHPVGTPLRWLYWGSAVQVLYSQAVRGLAVQAPWWLLLLPLLLLLVVVGSDCRQHLWVQTRGTIPVVTVRTVSTAATAAVRQPAAAAASGSSSSGGGGSSSSTSAG
jgi:hypothetical protein